ncbi:transcriptional regulator, LysR family [Rubrobacter xylanophilus DSM 9941]|uniref:Transcriptional regulator, LysR family n=1 Tax=Rubrobacter xylanophilus (strain DSM 9941 / JCM 11954 / NBRC 16129 / PRD-1) TaxID=266117 RepID=Q1AVK2_RUBXD|nr:LysR substrate-binding domain-containing protein [Rubrobacter xylanophilus]ABG04576.1 transcriptional regulator, LysR family [Rubrobacter xylanophilus DSM 9941]
MRLRFLEAFCAAVEEGSISGAARRMYLAQPSVSERLAELEREARVPLLVRSRRGVEPTEQGRLLYERARRVLDEVERVEEVLRSLRVRREARLYVAASSTLGEHLFPAWLRGFRERHPGVIPEVFVGNTKEVVALVGRGTVAFGVIEGGEVRGPLESVPLLEDELVVVVRPGHPWARRGVRPQELSREPFISREKGSGTREVVERAISDRGLSLDVRMELGSTSAIKEAIEAGLGFSLLSREAIRLELGAGHLAVARGFSVSRRFTLIRNPSAELNATEQGFCDYLLGICRLSGGRRSASAGARRLDVHRR